MAHPPVVLVVGGWDPSGAAGLAQDLKVLAALGVHACGAPAALTAQGQAGVALVQDVDPALLRRQLETLFKEQPVAAVKLGLLHAEPQLDVVAQILAAHPSIPVVIDPVLGASAGGSLVTPGYLEAFKARLLPLASILTPNLAEAAALTSLPVPDKRGDMPKLAYALLAAGAKAVLLKGGHLEGEASPDFYLDAEQEAWLDAPRIETKNSRGTGCALASAIAAGLANEKNSKDASLLAKDYLLQALRESAEDAWSNVKGPIRFDQAP